MCLKVQIMKTCSFGNCHHFEIPGLMIWSWKEDGKKTEYPLDFGDALEILFRVPGTKEIKSFTTVDGKQALIDVEAMTHTYVDTGRAFPIQRRV